MLVYTANEHAVFFDKAETRSSLASAGKDAGIPSGADKGQKSARPGGDLEFECHRVGR